MTNKVSIIMPTFNTGDMLVGSIDSILHQTYQNIELIIVDDCSSDSQTLELLTEYSLKDNRIKVIYLKENHGPSYARNMAIKEATGRYIAFCDSDDRWASNKLDEQIHLMNQMNCALCCSSYYICDSKYNVIGINIPPKHITLSQMKNDNKIGCTTAIYDTEKLGRKFYMPDLYKSEDWGLFLQIIKECKHCYSYTKEPLAYYCVRGNSLSNNKLSMIKYNIAVYEKVLGYGKTKSLMFFLLRFLPSYFLKVSKRKFDSFVLRTKRK